MDPLDFQLAAVSSPKSHVSSNSVQKTNNASNLSPSWNFFSANTPRSSSDGSPLTEASQMEAPLTKSEFEMTPDSEVSQSEVGVSPALLPFGSLPSFNMAHRRVSSQDVATSIGGLDILAKQGSWRAVLEKSKEGRLNSLNPVQKLAFSSFHILSLVKLRMFGAAADELEALGDLNSKDYLFQSFPDQFNGKSGSMVPFLLRYLQADLPHRIGQTQTSIDRLYDLMEFCESKLATISDAESQSVAVSIPLPDPDRTLTPSPPAAPPAAPPLPSSPSWNAANILEDLLSGPTAPETEPAASPELSAGPALTRDSFDSFSMSVDTPREGQSADVALPDSFKGMEEFEGVFELGTDEGMDSDEEFFRSMDEVRAVSETAATQSPQATVQALFEEGGRPAVSAEKDRWSKRKDMVLFSIIGCHLSQKEYVAGLQWLEHLNGSRPWDPNILAQVACVQMQMGDLTAAKESVRRLEALPAGNRSLAASVQVQLLRTQGLLLFAENEYAASLQAWDSLLELEPADYVAVNNKALCLMYSKDLQSAMEVLEEALQRDPVSMMREAVVLNLCSMYELASPNSTEAKRRLSNWIARIAPDDFDLQCTRL